MEEMAKVDFPDGTIPFLNPGAYAPAQAEINKSKTRGNRSVKKTPFSSFLDKAAVEKGEGAINFPDLPVSEETLKILLDDVHATGEELKEKPFPDQIKRYKTAVRNFLHYVVENGYAVEERTSGVNILKRKKFTLVQVVDRKLEQLAAGILSGQSSQMEILQRLDEISGLLINLLQ